MVNRVDLDLTSRSALCVNTYLSQYFNCWYILLQADMFNKEPEAAGFFFKSKYYYLSWGPAGNVNDLILGIYINTTSSGPKLDAEKLIYKTHLVSPGAIHTHWINPVHGYKMYLLLN